MKYHKIEVDDDVFCYLKEKAEPFIDTPNTVLKRELLNGKQKLNGSTKVFNKFPDLPAGIPSALQHTLEVIYLVKKHCMARPCATKAVALRHGVMPQTVHGKYCRQLDMKAYEIDQLLADPDIHKFKLLLDQKFINQRRTNEEFFGNLSF